MPIQVRYFASLRERLGRSEDSLDAGAVETVADVWTSISGGQPYPQDILTAVNHEHASPTRAVKDGDEVAFFPPVTGG